MKKKYYYPEYNKKWVSENKEKIKGYHKKFYWEHREEQLKDAKEYRKARRLLVIAHYSNNTNACACCGDRNIEFLTIDHINNDGAKHRKSIGMGGGATYGWLVKNQYPKGYQVLCFNCNCARGVYGYCPHTRKDWRRL